MIQFFLSLFLCFFLFLPSFGHGEDIAFRAKYKKIKINKVAMKALGIETHKVKAEIINEVIKTTGQIEEIPSSKFEINSPVQGKVLSVFVDLGSMVSVGEPLGSIESTEIAKLEAEVDQLTAELKLAKSSFEREKELFEKGISAKKEFFAAEAGLKSIEEMLTASKNNLRILTGDSLELENSDLERGIFTIRSKKSGTIIKRNITIGQIVDPSQILFSGVELNNVWASADVYEKDIHKIALNQKVYITLDGDPEKVFEGKLTYVGAVINRETRTLPVKALLNNKDGLFKPGAFIQLVIHTGQKKKSIVIPQTALVEIDKEETEGRHVHIVYLKKKDYFVPRKIKVEPHDSNSVEVISGLMVGEIIVTQGGYQLQYGEGDERDRKQNINFPIWIIVMVVLLALLIGFVVRKKKTV